ETLSDDSSRPAPVAVSLLRRNEPEAVTVATAVSAAHAHGVRLDWPAVFAGLGARTVDLPTYAFQRTRHWLEATPAAASAAAAGAATAGQPAGGPVGGVGDSSFWTAVRRGVLDELADTLGLAGERERAALGEVLPALVSWWERQQITDAVDAVRYRVVWRPVHDLPAGPPRGRWLLVVPADRRDAPLVTALTRALPDTVVLAVDRRHSTREGLAAELTAAAAAGPVDGVLSLLGLGDDTAETSDLPAGFAATVALVQAVEDAGTAAPLWLATHGAVATVAGEAVTAPAGALVWGLHPIVGVENPRRAGGVVDLPESVDERVVRQLVGVLAGGHGAGGHGAGGHGEVELAVRPSGVLARRLVPAPAGGTTTTAAITGGAAAATGQAIGANGNQATATGTATGTGTGNSNSNSNNGDGAPAGWRPGPGTVLVTGGSGALAGHVARWLAGRGAEHLLLVSRRGDGWPGAGELAAELAGNGTAVTYAAADVADRDQLAAVLAAIPPGQPLTAVVHTAAVLDDALLTSLTPERIERVLRVKAGGARHLDELTRDADLTAFVLFSSIAGTVGLAGQGNYAPGNAYLDALAERRRAAGRPATSVAWGLWSGAGIASADVAAHAGHQGFAPITPDVALAALGQALERGDTRLVVTEADWAAVAAARPHPLLRELPGVAAATAAAAGTTAQAAAEGADDGPATLVRRLAEASERQARRIVLELVRTEVAVVQKHASADRVDVTRHFREQGFDSLAAVELRNRLTARTGLALPATLVFDHPSPVELAEHLRDALVPAAGSGEASDSAPGQGSAPGQEQENGLDAPDGSITHPQAGTRTTEELLSASDDELIAFIGNELGIS
uniref:SDR family NAD(P)-dependent oxidoreductase n=1 Tax=Frankia sp. CiP1_Cm_nod2 TaxID=2897161 RepID=UPI0020259B9B